MSATKSATGIGAAVRRKEDLRFVTGKGQYTDDVVRPGETRAVFLRSPHAHDKIKSIDAAAAKKMPGVVAVFTGADLAADKIGGLICGWMIHSKDGSPMKAGAHPALAQGKVRYVGDHVAVVIATAAKDGNPVIHEVAPNNTVYNWHIGDKGATDAAFAAAAHVTKIDL